MGAVMTAGDAEAMEEAAGAMIAGAMAEDAEDTVGVAATTTVRGIPGISIAAMKICTLHLLKRSFWTKGWNGGFADGGARLLHLPGR